MLIWPAILIIILNPQIYNNVEEKRARHYFTIMCKNIKKNSLI